MGAVRHGEEPLLVFLCFSPVMFSTDRDFVSHIQGIFRLDLWICPSVLHITLLRTESEKNRQIVHHVRST